MGFHSIRRMIVFRSRRNQVIALIVIALCILYLSSQSEPEYDMDIARESEENKLQEALKEDKGTGCEIPVLDPFAKKVKKIREVVCNGQDWVRCYLHECRVEKKILQTTKNIKCTYRDIIYESDFKYHIGNPTTVTGDNVYVLVRSDYVKVTCTGKHINSIFFSSKWSGHAVGYRTLPEPSAPEGREHSVDVLIFGFDSTSKNGFIRMMPKSYKFLSEELGATVLNGYNVVGDGTPAALFPILTGKTDLELPDVRRSMSKDTMDNIPFIFYKLKEDGYNTAYFEDSPLIGTFQYRFNGFKRQPADHYMRAFFLEESSSGKFWKTNDERYCVGDTPRYKLMMNLTEQFFQLPGKHFAFTFIVELTHDNCTMISTADRQTVHFLTSLRDSGRLDNTLLFVMGDHGPRYTVIRDTVTMIEERLPLMAIRLPRTLREKRPDIQANLEANKQTLTTPHDIHATILDAMDMMQHRNLYKIQGADLYRGLSLLKPIPRSRSCSEAGIQSFWCSCLNWKYISVSDQLYNLAAISFVKFINDLTEPLRSKCALRLLTSILWVGKRVSNNRLLEVSRNLDSDWFIAQGGALTVGTKDTYLIKVTVGPGHGIYEAAATYIIKENKFVYNTRQISRVNAYNDEPSCISATHPHLNMYCYCNGRI